MARHRLLIVAVAMLSLGGAVAYAADPPKDENAAPAEKAGKRRGKMSPEFENVRKAIDALTPEQRKRFQENFVRWSNMSPEAKKALRDREEFRRKKMAEDVEAAIQELGVDLDKERREQFAKRYVEERRKIEVQIRREMEEKRRPLVKDLVARLKQEFASSTTAPAP
jgi:hypothetical protein